MRTKLLNKKGVALVTVVLFFLVLVILLAGVMFASVSNQGNAIISKEHSNSYFSAESGMNVILEKLVKYLSVGYSEFPAGNYAAKRAALEAYILGLNNRTDVMDGINLEGNYLINVIKVDDVTYTLRSTGTVNNVTRVVEGTFKFDPILDNLAKAVISKGSITMGNNATIDGPIASLMQNGPYLKNNGQIDVGPAVVDVHNNGGVCQIDEVYVPNTSSSSVSVDGCTVKKTMASGVTFNDFTIPAYPTVANLEPVTLAGNKITFTGLNGKQGYYIDALPTSAFEIDTGAGNGNADPIKLYVGSVATNIGNITVKGNDQVKVHITINASNTGNPNNTFTWASNVNVGKTDMTEFQLVIRKGTGFSAGVDPFFTIPNGNTFVGSILMDYVNIELKNMTYTGFIGTLGQRINTGSNGTISGPMWVYAPNAVVDMSSGITIYGSVMASSVSLTSGATIIYDAFKSVIPFELNLPIFMGGAPVPVGITFKFINFREV